MITVQLRGGPHDEDYRAVDPDIPEPLFGLKYESGRLAHRIVGWYAPGPDAGVWDWIPA